MIPADLRQLLEGQRRLTRAVHDDGMTIMRAIRDHAGGGR